MNSTKTYVSHCFSNTAVATTKPTQSFSSVTGQKGSTGKKASPWVPGDPRTGVEVVKGVKKPHWKP